MHYVTKIFMLIFLLANTTSLFAMPQKKTCPPLSIVAATQFTQALPSYPDVEENDLWIFTNNINYQNMLVQIWFGLHIANIDTAEKALVKGQAIFNQEVKLSQPVVMLDDNYQFVCRYAYSENNYSVYTFSPPLRDPR